MAVPLIDASHLEAGGQAREYFLKDFVNSFQRYGFVRLKNHGVSSDQVQQVFTWVRGKCDYFWMSLLGA